MNSEKELLLQTAALIEGKKYEQESLKSLEIKLNQLGLVLIHGYNANSIIFSGAYLEGTPIDGAVYIYREGILEHCKDGCIHFKKALLFSRLIEATFDGSWKIDLKDWESDLYVKIKILENEGKYGDGVLIHIEDLFNY